MSRVLLVDDEPEFLEATSRALQHRGFAVGSALDGAAALSELGRAAYDVVVLDVRLATESGVDLFRRVHELYPLLPVILLTGHGAVRQAFETIREGVFEYLTKPCSIDKLARVTERAVAAKTTAAQAAPDMNAPTIRVLLAAPGLEDAIAASLRGQGMRVLVAADASMALMVLAREDVDVAVIDLDLEGPAVLTRMQQLRPALAVILLTAEPDVTVETLTRCDGAFDVMSRADIGARLARRVRDAWEAGRAFPAKPT